MYEVTMTVRRTFRDDDIPFNIQHYVENHLSDDPDYFLSKVSRSEVDWEWRVVSP